MKYPNWQIHGDGEQISFQGMEEKEKKELLLMAMGFLFKVMKYSGISDGGYTAWQIC